MPWTKLSNEDVKTICKESFENVAKSRDYNQLIEELVVRTEILKHDFTKRQMVILMFIFTFSFAYGKRDAYIPKLQDFELAGISKTKVKSELMKMVNMNVIEWNQEDNLFSIRSIADWKVPYNSGYNDDRARDLFLLNLEHGNYDVASLIEKLNKIK